jgi:DNA replication and repair protein RecF
MFIQNLNLINFRSYPALSITFPPQGALLEGLNGAGKTNLLESIHLLCTGRSQRPVSRADMISHGEESAFAEGEFCGTGGGAVTASIGFSRDKKLVMRRGGEEVRSYSDWFGERPVVSFGTDDLELVYGAPETRRKFLDMLICQMDRGYLGTLTKYRRNLACRNALLGKTGDPAQFEVYEHAMAAAGAEVVFRRAEAAGELCAAANDFYACISNGGESITIEYIPKYKYDLTTTSEWQNVYLNSLAERRPRDAELMYTSQGPHRDDLRFLLNGRPAKSYASQGQCRSFALSLKLGSVLLLERHKGDSMIFLIDDAVSELDPERTSRVYPLLEGRGQIFIATPRCQVKLGDGMMRCRVEPGKVIIP